MEKKLNGREWKQMEMNKNDAMKKGKQIFHDARKRDDIHNKFIFVVMFLMLYGIVQNFTKVL